MDSKRIENAFIEVVEALGDVEYKEELKDTPKRIADSYKEIFYEIGREIGRASCRERV